MFGRRCLAKLAIGLTVGLGLMASGGAQSEQLFREHSNDYLTLQGGVWESGLGGNRERHAAAFGAEYRWGAHLWIVHPFVGINGTSKGGVYGYGGLLLDISLIDRLWFTPSFAVGGFSRGGGSDLGHVIEFRSGFELSYEFENKSRLGVRYEHISNAGISDTNPGTENIWLVFTVPVSKLFGK